MSCSRRLVAGLEVGYGSHPLGSRTLDMAAAADFDGDGRVEVLVPTHTWTRLAAIRRTHTAAAMVWAVPVGGHLSTNLTISFLRDFLISRGFAKETSSVKTYEKS